MELFSDVDVGRLNVAYGLTGPWDDYRDAATRPVTTVIRRNRGIGSAYSKKAFSRRSFRTEKALKLLFVLAKETFSLGIVNPGAKWVSEPVE